MKRVIRALTLLGAATAVYYWLTRRREQANFRTEIPARPERRAVPDTEALSADSQDAVALDLERLTSLKSSSYKPLADHLTAIRIRRGSEESLLFVRKRDVDDLAALVGSTQEEFLENFRKLGVVVSLN